MSVSPSREAALQALLQIGACRLTLKQALAESDRALDRRDRALCLEIVAGVLRNRTLIDWTLSRFLKKPLHKSPPPLVEALRMGVFQLLFMDRIPPHSAIHESVDLVRRHAGEHLTGLTNAVLRNVDRDRADWTPPAFESDPNEFLRVTLSHPGWLLKRWLHRWGFDAVKSLCRANNEHPPITLRINTRRTSVESFIKTLGQAGIRAEATRLSPTGVRLSDEASLGDIPDSLWSSFQVQDEAAQLVPPLLDLKPGHRVLDACAAPGGKSTHMAELMDDTGEVWAVDVNPSRASKINENARRLGLTSVRSVVADLLEPQNMGRFDRILLDAPCSGLGVLRRNPDIRWCRHETDLARNHDIQKRLLSSCSRLLSAGGRMIYSVCSLEPEEGAQVVEAFARESGFRVEDISRHPSDAPWFLTLPHRDGTDGFFAACLVPSDDR